MKAKGRSGGWAEAGDDVEHTGGKSGFDSQFRQPQGRKRRLLGGFQYDAVADGQCGRDLPHGEVEGKIPRRHRADDAKGLSADEGEIAGLGRRDLTADLVQGLAVECEKVCSRGDVDVVRLGHQLAHVQGVEQGEFGAVLTDELGQPGQYPLASGGRSSGPHAGFEGCAPTGHGGVDVGVLRRRDLREQRPGGGVDRLEGFARSRVAKPAVDEHAGPRCHVCCKVGPMGKRGGFGCGECQRRLLRFSGWRPVRPA
jgi:hypothetical protein